MYFKLTRNLCFLEDQTGIVPTVGFSAQTLNYEGYSVVIYDLGGGPQIRGIWPEYYVDVSAYTPHVIQKSFPVDFSYTLNH